MRKKLPSAEAPLPKFRSDEEAAEYFETHSIADVWDQLLEGKHTEPSRGTTDTLFRKHAASRRGRL
jgi:hypothetical protein